MQTVTKTDYRQLAEKIWQAINKVTSTDEWETEDRYSEKMNRHRLDHYVKDDKDLCTATITTILDESLTDRKEQNAE
ncbi:hypothetical protein KGQ27_02530 [Patescibacteria group bacterium]|nr:hypothetical protein [Patescibacteria group bacterium]MDE1946443.1 hypothetical protein [Patescibacteria group bacterium]MDE2011051.1 hypothetical protein [Patescibacteria group bacterium]MDE2233530.1 hypothetical protein [Patescibacteria group bacterium]